MKKILFEEIDFSLPIKLEFGLTSCVELGQVIKKDDVIAIVNKRNNEVINFFKKLKLKNKKNKGLYVRVAVGDRCRKGAVLVENHEWFSKSRILCPYEAMIVRVTDSEIEIEQLIEKEIVSPLSGKIESMDEHQIIISSTAWQYKFAYAGGKSVWGDLVIFADQEDLDSDWLSSKYENKIIVINNLTQVLWQKANALGVKGLIAKQAPSTFEQWIDNRRDNCGVLVYEENDNEWDKLVDYLFGLENPCGFILVDQKTLVVR